MRIIPREVVKGVITNSKEIRDKRLSLQLNTQQKLVIAGSLLGDGSLTPNAWGKNFRFHIQHSVKQKDYLFWKYEIFKNFTLSPPSYQPLTNSWMFRTISHCQLTDLTRKFYSNGRKIVPSNIAEVLKDPLSLAVWFMDDGAISSRRDGLIINTQSFKLGEQLILIACLEDNFQIKGISVNKDKGYFRLYLNKQAAWLFKNIIAKFVLKSFSYKLLLTP